MRKIFLAALLFAAASASGIERHGMGLTAEGSDKTIHTVFICPGEDCSTQMRLSWATPLSDSLSFVNVYHTDGTPAAAAVRSTYEPCATFDSINSKLYDNSDAFERHAFLHHQALIQNLKPATNYICAISVPQAGPTSNASETRSFRTAGDKAWKAAIISDFHHYSPLWRRLDAAMGMMNVLASITGGFDWVLCPGDQCAWGASYNYWTELSEQPVYQSHMWAAVQGNHDHMSRDKILSDNYFRDTHAFPPNGYAGQEGVSYWFRYGDVLFIMLNNEAMHTADTLDKAKEWIKQVAEATDARYKVVVEHYEWLIGTDGSNSQLDRFFNLFDHVGIDLAISGNNHAYLRTYPLYNRRPVEAQKGTTYIVLPSSDDSRGRQLNDIADNDDIIATRWSEGPHTVGAMIMDVDPTRIILTLYDRHGNTVDTATIPARR